MRETSRLRFAQLGMASRRAAFGSSLPRGTLRVVILAGAAPNQPAPTTIGRDNATSERHATDGTVRGTSPAPPATTGSLDSRPRNASNKKCSFSPQSSRRVWHNADSYSSSRAT